MKYAGKNSEQQASQTAAQCLGSLFHVELEIPHRAVITQALGFTYIAPEIGEEEAGQWQVYPTVLAPALNTDPASDQRSDSQSNFQTCDEGQLKYFFKCGRVLKMIPCTLL